MASTWWYYLKVVHLGYKNQRPNCHHPTLGSSLHRHHFHSKNLVNDHHRMIDLRSFNLCHRESFHQLRLCGASFLKFLHQFSFQLFIGSLNYFSFYYLNCVPIRRSNLNLNLKISNSFSINLWLLDPITIQIFIAINFVSIFFVYLADSLNFWTVRLWNPCN